MTDHIPTKAVWLNIPDTCRMRSEFDPDHRLEFTFGGHHDGVNVVFERQALERFVTLANNMLAIPVSDDTQADLPKLEAPTANNTNPSCRRDRRNQDVLVAGALERAAIR